MVKNSALSASKTARNQGTAYDARTTIVHNCEALLKNWIQLSGNMVSVVSRSFASLLMISPLAVTSKYSVTGALNTCPSARWCKPVEARLLTTDVSPTRAASRTAQRARMPKAKPVSTIPEPHSVINMSAATRKAWLTRNTSNNAMPTENPAVMLPSTASPKCAIINLAEIPPVALVSRRVRELGLPFAFLWVASTCASVPDLRLVLAGAKVVPCFTVSPASTSSGCLAASVA
mmetsp:Transcript_103850/g.303138  ORF Transcript_103850/g.303138 Transcript_103850/m.303138 type:complete len:233 (+) Transcript_103850:1279-1977(+)